MNPQGNFLIFFKLVLAFFSILLYDNGDASVAQWIEQWPPEPRAEVRFLSDAFFYFCKACPAAGLKAARLLQGICIIRHHRSGNNH